MTARSHYCEIDWVLFGVLFGGAIVGGAGVQSLACFAIWLWVKTNGIPFWGRCTTHFRTYFSGWIGMFTGGTVWILTHGHINQWLGAGVRKRTKHLPGVSF